MVDPDEGIVTDLMLGSMIAFGADIVVLVGFLWAAGYVSATTFGIVTVLIVAFYAGWIGWRWRSLGEVEPSERSPVEELKYRYANGELSEEEFERRLDRIIDDPKPDERTADTFEISSERSK